MTEETYIDGIPTEDYGKPWSKSFYPEFQQTENGCKVSVPLFTNLELKELDYNIQTHYDEIIKQISETVSKDKENIVLQRIIQKQDTEINKLNNVIDRMAEQLWILDDTNEEDCFIPREYSDINDCVKKGSCKNCIKEYFMIEERRG